MRGEGFGGAVLICEGRALTLDQRVCYLRATFEPPHSTAANASFAAEVTVNKSICIFSGHANPKLAEQIADSLQLTVGRMKLSNFSDGEVFTEIQENVRGADVYVVQPTCAPVNDNLMELLVTVDALKRASAGSITAVIPYYGYGRQDRKVAPRTPITAKLVADLLQTSGVSRVVSMDLHAGQIQGFFNVPFDHLFGMPVMLDYLRPRLLPVVSSAHAPTPSASRVTSRSSTSAGPARMSAR